MISRWMLDKAQAYGYKKVGFILDRGYFSKKNIESMDQCGYSFVIMVKGMASFIRQLITENKGSFEEEGPTASANTVFMEKRSKESCMLQTRKTGISICTITVREPVRKKGKLNPRSAK